MRCMAHGAASAAIFRIRQHHLHVYWTELRLQPCFLFTSSPAWGSLRSCFETHARSRHRAFRTNPLNKMCKAEWYRAIRLENPDRASDFIAIVAVA
jgi:hypothetical protein